MIYHQLNFDLRHLRSFCAVAELLHFRQAADQLHVAQPALSRQIQQLEEAIGVVLFERSTRSVALTLAGARFEPHARAILERCAHAAALAADAEAGRAGRLRVGISGPAMLSTVPRLLRDFRRRFPDHLVDVVELPTSEQLARLDAGDLDVGFFLRSPASSSIETQVVSTEITGVGLPPGHRFSTRKKLRLAELSGEPFILFPRERNPSLYDRILAGLRETVDSATILEASSRQVAAGMVEAGLGSSTFALSMKRLLGRSVPFVPLRDPGLDVVLVMGWRKGSHNPFAQLL